LVGIVYVLTLITVGRCDKKEYIFLTILGGEDGMGNPSEDKKGLLHL
jgi:hypothetical protein